jgi:glycosyltransferase involved in cell wall biosynthesis
MNPFQGIFHYKNDELNNPSISKIDKEIKRLKNTFIHRNQNIHIVCLTDWMYQASKKSAILGKYPHYLIPNGLDFNQFKTALSKNELKATYSINNNNKTLLFISQDIKNPRKGFDLLKNSLDLITDTPFNVVTVGNNQVELPTNFNHIHFNPIDDLGKLNELYMLADLFLLPSREDNLPNVMLESFANGTPIISFNTGGMKDWVVPYKNGILVDDFSTKQFAQELLNFANNNYIFDAEYIRSYAEQNFNQLEQTKKYTELYQNILNK